MTGVTLSPVTARSGLLIFATLLATWPLRSRAEPQPNGVSTQTFVLNLTADPFSASIVDRMVALADGTRFVLGSGASNSASAEFLLKVNPNGTQAWAVPAVDARTATVTGLAADSSGNAYVAYTDFSIRGEPHARLVKFNASGGVAARADLATDTAGGDGFPFSAGIAVDPVRGRVYATHSFYSGTQNQDTFAITAFDTVLQPVTGPLIHNPGFTGSFLGPDPKGGTFVDASGDVWVVGLRNPPDAPTGELFAARYGPNLAGGSVTTLPSFSAEEVGAATDPRGGVVVAGDGHNDGNLYLHRVTVGGFGPSFRFEGFDIVPSPMAVDSAGSLYIVGYNPATFLSAVAKIDTSNALAWNQPGPYLSLPDTLSPGAIAAASSTTFDVAGVAFNVNPSPVILLHYQARTSSATDNTPPGAIADLAVARVFISSAALAWTAPGDDAGTGTAKSYDLRYSTLGPILSEAAFDASTQAINLPVPSVAGSSENFVLVGLIPSTTYFFAIKTGDEAGNIGALSNSPSALTRGGFALSISAGNAQAGTVTKKPRVPLTVKVTNVLGEPVVGSTITFSTASAPAGAVGHSLSILSTTTAQDGTAATVLTFGDHVGTYTVTAACAGCAPAAVEFAAVAELRLVISISPISIRPLGTGTPTEPAGTTILVTAAGISFPTDRVENYPVLLVSTPVAFSGGHNHHAGRPTGYFNVPGNPSSVETISNGFLGYVASAFGGLERITAKSMIDDQVRPWISTVTVEVPGLTALPASTSYDKIGGTPFHPGPPMSANDTNHYGAADVIALLPLIAADYAASFPSRPILKYNDISLIFGGLFDVSGQWRPDHKTHRTGREVDIRSKPPHEDGIMNTGRDYAEFKRIVRNRTADTARVEIHSNGTENEHVHIYF